jgi:hypothetical protein
MFVLTNGNDNRIFRFLSGIVYLSSCHVSATDKR